MLNWVKIEYKIVDQIIKLLFQLEVVALDKQTYDTRYKVLDMTVNKNENFAKFQIQLKIDNLNVEDLFDSNRTQNLFNIFK